MKITDFSVESKHIQITDLSDNEALKITGGEGNEYYNPPVLSPPWPIGAIPEPVPCPPNPGRKISVKSSSWLKYQ